jgi:hypothetical protein
LPILSQCGDILKEFARDLELQGAVGVTEQAKLLYFVLTTRVFDRPLSVTIKGTNSTGKSYLVQSVLKFFPSSAYYTFSSMTLKALIYLAEPLSHRTIIMYESSGMADVLSRAAHKRENQEPLLRKPDKPARFPGRTAQACSSNPGTQH